MKVDLVIWAKNGAKYLPLVLRRVDEVIPEECIFQRVFVDDHSTDRSREIAKDFNWTIYMNPASFVSGGSNEALRHVAMPFFVSIEQDVLLSKDWWDKIPKHVQDNRVAIAQGIRVIMNPLVHSLNIDYTDNLWSLDNNIYRTSVIRALDGFPTTNPLSVDYYLMKEIVSRTKYRWIIDSSVVSEHLRSGLRDHLGHSLKWVRLGPLLPRIFVESLRAKVKIFSGSTTRGDVDLVKGNGACLFKQADESDG